MDDRLAELERRIVDLEQRPYGNPSTELAHQTPWWWKNPLANKAQQNAVISTRSAVIQEYATITSDFTTTDTASLHDVITVNIRVPPGSVALFIFCHFAVRHSVAGAQFDAHLTLNDSVSYVGAASLLDLNIQVTALNTPVALVRSLSKSDLDSVPIIRGRDVTIGLTIQNDTAGTLTIPGTGGQIPSLTAFLTGDSSL